MENRIGLFVFIFSFLRVAVHSDAISASSDFFLDYDDFGTDIAFYDPEMFNEESESPTSFLDDTDDFNPELFSSSTQDGCVSLMSADDTNLFGMGQEARVRPRAESCPNPGSSTPDTGVPNFGLFNPGSSLFNLMNPPDNPAKPPAQIYPGQPERDLIKEHLERMYQLNNAGEEEDDDEDEDPCPFHLVSDLHIPVCDSGNYAKDVQRIAGEYFFDLFNIRYFLLAFPCFPPEMLWCCYSVGTDHHPSYPPDAPMVSVGRLCLNPAIEANVPANDDRRLPIGKDPGKPLL